MTRETKAAAAAEVWRTMIDRATAQLHRTASTLQTMGLTPGHLKLMMFLSDDEPRPMGALAADFRCDASTMTWLVDRAEEREIVERRTLPEDRRVKAVAMTAKGRALKADLEARLYEPPPALLGLDRATLDVLREALEKIEIAAD